jgi:hypothetical protein
MFKLALHTECYVDLHTVLLKEQELWPDYDVANGGVQRHAVHESNDLRLARGCFSHDNINTVHFSF